MGSLPPNPFDVAIVGGGIAGVVLALGLLSRGIPIKLYERAGGFHEIGAGIGMSPNAERAMLKLDPRIHAVFRENATPNTEDWFQYVDGFNNSQQGDGEALLFKIYLGNRGFEGCRRSDFLAGMAKMIPADCIEFNKEVIAVTEGKYHESNNHKTLLHFGDGAVAQADIVLGCDGLRSKVRQLILGSDNPASLPSYSHKFAFRGLIPMEKARKALGDDKSSTRYMHLGHNAHALTFPVAMGTMLNVVAFVTDPGDWPSKERLTLPANKQEAISYFTDFGPVVTTIIGMLDDRLDKWGIFDLFDNPVPSYVSEGGHICLVGDAAHGAAPHHGAGAGCAIEDALALAVVLEDAATILRTSPDADVQKDTVLQTALSAYQDVRYERTRWVVETSRFIGEMYEWQVPEIGNDSIKGLAEAELRCRKIWDYDIDEMVQETKRLFSAKIRAEKEPQI